MSAVAKRRGLSNAEKRVANLSRGLHATILGETRLWRVGSVEALELDGSTNSVLVAGVTTIAAYDVYGEVLLHPDQISAKFDSWFLALLAALTFAVATLGINVVANFVSPAFDFSNVFPRQIDFKKGGYIAALIALILYPFAPWEGSAASFVGIIGATMGPIFGVMMVDYYLIRKGEVDVEALYREDGEFRFQGGWHVNAFIAAGIGAVFSSILPNFTNWLPVWWGVYGWFFGVAIAGVIYYILRSASAAVPVKA